MDQLLEELSYSRNYTVTYDVLCFGLSKDHGVSVSRDTTSHHIKANWTVCRLRSVPSLNEFQTKKRLQLATEHRRPTWENWVDVDMKWFYYVWTPSIVKVPSACPFQDQRLEEHVPHRCGSLCP